MRNRIPIHAWSAVAIDLSVVLYAIWTVCCHLTLFVRGNSYHLLIIASLGFSLASIAFSLAVRRGYLERILRASVTVSDTEVASGLQRSDRIAGAAGLLVAAAFLCGFRAHTDGWLHWKGAFCFAFSSGIWLLFRPATDRAESDLHADGPRFSEIGLWILAALGAYVALVMDRPNSDDAFYLHWAVSTADRPHLEILAHDTMHDAGQTILPAYRIHSFELLAGILSLVTGIPVINIVHLGFAGIAGFLLPLAWARLFRILDPRRWFWMVLVVLAWYLLDGTSDYSAPTHAFVRIFQGKAVIYSVGIPILTTYGIRFGLRPGWGRFWMLVAGQVSVVGLSCPGLWIAPVGAVVGVLIPLAPRLASARVIGWGLLSCAYVIGMGLWVRSQMDELDLSTVEAAVSQVTSSQPYLSQFQRNLRQAFAGACTQSGRIQVPVYVSVLLLSWPLAHTQLARRYLVVFGLAFLFILGNPFLESFVRSNLTGHSTYNRVTWILPTAGALAVCFTTLLLERPSRLRPVLFAVSLAGAAFFFHQVPCRTVLEIANPGFLPTLKVSDHAYRTALRVAEAFPLDSHVLATGSVSRALAMVNGHPYLTIVKTKFFSERSEGHRRFKMRRQVDGSSRRMVKPLVGYYRYQFIRRLDRFRVDGIVSRNHAEKKLGFVQTMRQAGFRRLHTGPHYTIWRRNIERGARR